MAFIPYTDPQLGLIHYRVNARAKHIILRPDSRGVLITFPPYCTEQAVAEALEKFRASLAEKRTELFSHRIIDWNFRIEAPLLHFSLQEGVGTQFTLRQKEGEAVLVCPPNTHFTQPGMQEWLEKVVVRVLVHQAQVSLLPRLRALSERVHLPYEKGGIRNSKGRWGSCSGRKSINLSCYTLLLPQELMEYVMLHELMHTREMNHGDRFWSGLDALTGGRAKQLDKALNDYTTSIFLKKR